MDCNIKDELINKRNMLQESSDESDVELKILPKKPEIKKQNKNGALWMEMLEEENLMEDMKTFEVARDSRKRKILRGAESYDYDNDEKSSCQKDNGRSSHVPERKKLKIKKNNVNAAPKLLADLDKSKCDAEDLALKLDEENVELIKKVVTVIGIEECLKYYEKTQHIESNGGMLTFNKQRRRTSGGIFLYLIKSSNKLTSEQRMIIFEK